jgi:copper chaperone CopZ
VQAALQAVKGVKKAAVSMEKKEAVVDYDADVTNVDTLIKAVKDADGPHAPYDAKVKKKIARLQ